MSDSYNKRDDTDQKLRVLGEQWQAVYMSYYPEFRDGNFIIRNQTDEGLPAGTELKEVRAESFTDALDEAVNRYVNTDTERSDS